jgi:hypothetical protein
LAAFAVLCCLQAGRASASEPVPLEYRLKAAFLLNFAKFVEWPGSDRTYGKPFSFCVVGSDGFGPALEDTIAGKELAGRATNVRRLRTHSDAKNCNVLFIAASERGRVQEILQSLAAEPVLTVSEIPRFAERGGMINFVLKDNRIHFEINPQRASRVGLRISSHLLQLASVVATQDGGR